MCSSAPPPAPDYAGAAREQGVANAEAARTQGRINNPNVYGPYGSQVVTWDGDTPTLTQTLSPEQQRLLASRTRSQQGLADLASQGTEAASGIIGRPVDFSGMPSEAAAYQGNGTGVDAFDPRFSPRAPNAYQAGRPGLPDGPQASGAIRDQVIAAMMGRAGSAIDKSQEQVKSDLAARGITPNTEAYAREMDAIGRQRNDAQQQAELAGQEAANTAFNQDLARRNQAYGERTTDANLSFSQGSALRDMAAREQAQRFGQAGQEAQLRQSQQNQTFSQSDALRRQAITEALARRQIPLNEITALMSGSQVSNPFSTPGYAQNTQVAPAPTFGATQQAGQYGTDVYNAQTAQRNSNTGAAASLAGTAAMAMMMF